MKIIFKEEMLNIKPAQNRGVSCGEFINVIYQLSVGSRNGCTSINLKVQVHQPYSSQGIAADKRFFN
jgi:hypothetical protein